MPARKATNASTDPKKPVAAKQTRKPRATLVPPVAPSEPRAVQVTLKGGRDYPASVHCLTLYASLPDQGDGKENVLPVRVSCIQSIDTGITVAGLPDDRVWYVRTLLGDVMLVSASEQLERVVIVNSSGRTLLIRDGDPVAVARAIAVDELNMVRVGQ